MQKIGDHLLKKTLQVNLPFRVVTAQHFTQFLEDENGKNLFYATARREQADQFIANAS